MRKRPPERGAALLTVLLLVALVAVMAGTALEKLRLSTRLAANAVAADQARSYAQAAEALATARIGTLLRATPGRVTLIGGWSNRPVPVPVPGGLAVARVVDGGNCFNLNALVAPAGTPGAYRSNPIAAAALVRLMQLIGIPQQAGTGIAAAVGDWIDSDGDQQGGGAEDGAYRGGATPYLTPGTLMADPSELRAVAGVTPALYAQLRPWVCTLPTTVMAINANTLLPEQAPLLAMLYADGVGVEQARRTIAARPVQGWGDEGAMKTAAAITADATIPPLFTTGWFTLSVAVTLGTTGLEESALIDARSLPAQVVRRQWGEAS